jgi:hypothetical protein
MGIEKFTKTMYFNYNYISSKIIEHKMDKFTDIYTTKYETDNKNINNINNIYIFVDFTNILYNVIGKLSLLYYQNNDYYIDIFNHILE